jgi:hypothetical protein
MYAKALTDNKQPYVSPCGCLDADGDGCESTTLMTNGMEPRSFKGSAPLGGFALMGGWLALAVARLPK